MGHLIATRLTGSSEVLLSTPGLTTTRLLARSSRVSLSAPGSTTTVLSTAVFRDCLVQQLDVKNAFLHDTLIETVFCSQPTGFANPAYPDLLCRLHKSLYGLK
jgi:hypothetical protein